VQIIDLLHELNLLLQPICKAENWLDSFESRNSAIHFSVKYTGVNVKNCVSRLSISCCRLRSRHNRCTWAWAGCSGHWLPALAGFGAGAIGGGLIGGLAGLGIPEHEAELYRGELEKGGILLGIFAPSDDRAREAQRLMEANNAEHLHCTNTKETVAAK
jgi:hypothetical protein